MPVRGSGVTPVMLALSRMVPVLALLVTLMWMRQATPAAGVPRRHVTVAARGAVQRPLPAAAVRKAVPAGRWPVTAACS